MSSANAKQAIGLLKASVMDAALLLEKLESRLESEPTYLDFVIGQTSLQGILHHIDEKVTTTRANVLPPLFLLDLGYNSEGKDTKLPDGDYILEDGAAWFTVKENFSVRVLETDDGVVVDIYAAEKEMEDSLASCYAFDVDADKVIQA